ncbi:hypothetical protein [Yersinia mollaretii]|uniref:hypothetical protein n=1 Tax=Yersinia mollaretii TaxID=33060 RepID=UPI0005DFEE58|nr:hypothetical protein [Yersinia mollaretii]MDN0111969.1 hypothetical protein [Yersinia mollaretii]PJE87088.1 hypothetical protein CU280_14855 [Yersinia mollaretii]CQD40967.1 Uncharacterised protein [Yersinia mollaretii]CQH44004.1 Uncharacterised protein [Yersinia mollaretii]
MNVRDCIQFYNNLAASLPIIDQKNKIKGKCQKNPLILPKKIIKVCDKSYSESNAPKNHLNKESNINKDEHIAANKIKHYFRDHLEKLGKMESGGLCTDKGLIKTTYFGKNKSIHGREYYHSRNKDHPIVYKPSEIPSGAEKGGYKIVTRKDNRFVALEPIQKDDLFEMDNDFNDIKDIRSIKAGLTVSPKLIIAHNAGKCVFDCISDGDTIPDSAFKNAVNDLKILHQRNGYLRDIKPENTAYDGKQVNFIDVDDRISRDSGEDPRELSFKRHGAEAVFTKEYITSKLVNKIYDKEYDLLNNEKIADYLKSADEHAFLLTFIAATTESHTLRSDILAVGNKKLRSNKYELTKWIVINIKPEHIHKANLLLFSPDSHAILGNNIYLADMLQFSGK